MDKFDKSEVNWHNPLSCGMPRIFLNEYYFHVTLEHNIPSIFSSGLIPSIGPCSMNFGETVPRTYLFCSIDDAIEGISSWLGEEFPEDEPLAILRIHPTKDIEIIAPDSNAFEAYTSSIIPASSIERMSDDEIFDLTGQIINDPSVYTNRILIEDEYNEKRISVVEKLNKEVSLQNYADLVTEISAASFVGVELSEQVMIAESMRNSLETVYSKETLDDIKNATDELGEELQTGIHFGGKEKVQSAIFNARKIAHDKNLTRTDAIQQEKALSPITIQKTIERWIKSGVNRKQLEAVMKKCFKEAATQNYTR